MMKLIACPLKSQHPLTSSHFHHLLVAQACLVQEKKFRVTFLYAPHKLHTWEIIYVKSIKPQHMSYC